MMVLVTLALVSGLLFFNLEKSRQLQRDMSRKADLEAVAVALGVYRRMHETYPPAGGEEQIMACGEKGEEACVWNQPWSDGKYLYLEDLPSDPAVVLGKNWRQYGYRREEERFFLWAFLERSDPEAVLSAAKCAGQWQANQYVVCSE